MSNIVDFKKTDIKEKNSSIKKLEKKKLRELIMSMETKYGKKTFLAIEKSCEGKHVTWAKYKRREEVASCASHLPDWIFNVN